MIYVHGRYCILQVAAENGLRNHLTVCFWVGSTKWEIKAFECPVEWSVTKQVSFASRFLAMNLDMFHLSRLVADGWINSLRHGLSVRRQTTVAQKTPDALTEKLVSFVMFVRKLRPKNLTDKKTETFALFYLQRYPYQFKFKPLASHIRSITDNSW